MLGVSHVVVAPDDLTTFVADLFASSGLSYGDSMLTASTLVEADPARGGFPRHSPRTGLPSAVA